MAAVALRQHRGADIHGQAVNVAVAAQRAGLCGIGGIVPCAFADAHHARTNIGGHHRADRDLTAIVKSAHQIAALDAAPGGVPLVNQDLSRLATACFAQRRVIKLGMQPQGRMGGIQRQRPAFGRFAAMPLQRRQPAGQTGAVGIVHARDALREDFNFARRRAERIEQRSGAKIGEAHPLFIRFRIGKRI